MFGDESRSVDVKEGSGLQLRVRDETWVLGVDGDETGTTEPQVAPPEVVESFDRVDGEVQSVSESAARGGARSSEGSCGVARGAGEVE